MDEQEDAFIVLTHKTTKQVQYMSVEEFRTLIQHHDLFEFFDTYDVQSTPATNSLRVLYSKSFNTDN